MRLAAKAIVVTLALSAIVAYTSFLPVYADTTPSWAVTANTGQVDWTEGIVLKKVKSVKSADETTSVAQSGTIDLTSRKRESVEKNSVTEEDATSKITVAGSVSQDQQTESEDASPETEAPEKESKLSVQKIVDVEEDDVSASADVAEATAAPDATADTASDATEQTSADTATANEPETAETPIDIASILPIAPEQVNGMTYTYAKVDTFLSIRVWRTSRSEVVGHIKPGDIVFIMADAGNDWVYVESGDSRGFVSAEFLATQDEAKAMYTQYKSDKVADLLIAPDQNPAYDYLEWKDDAARVQEMDDRYKAEPGQDIVDYARQFVGGPYVWGGNSLTNGIDCSHFVYQVLKNTGYYSGGYTTSSGWRSLGSYVDSLSDAQAGDVICYSGHVAIYDGNGKIIEAQGRKTGITDYRSASGGILAIRRFTE